MDDYHISQMADRMDRNDYGHYNPWDEDEEFRDEAVTETDD